jgi:ribA/ribD-fused uncharacterized protein
VSEINDFRGEYFFLSNFMPCSFEYKGYRYKSIEHAFQALKSTDPKEHNEIAEASKPGIAKSMGRRANLRKDWEEIKDDLMYELVLSKFSQNKSFKEMLLKTIGSELIEGNTWGDTYWGFDVRSQKGKNKLGKILMRVRETIQNK